MPTQTNFRGAGRAYTWETFFDGLQHGHISAYLFLLALFILASVAFWAGSNLMRKESRR
jgi:hypothetical protein